MVQLLLCLVAVLSSKLLKTYPSIYLADIVTQFFCNFWCLLICTVQV